MTAAMRRYAVGGRPDAPSDPRRAEHLEFQPAREATRGMRLRTSASHPMSAASAALMVQSGVSTAFTPPAIPATPSVPPATMGRLRPRGYGVAPVLPRRHHATRVAQRQRCDHAGSGSRRDGGAYAERRAGRRASAVGSSTIRAGRHCVGSLSGGPDRRRGPVSIRRRCAPGPSDPGA